jgi:hypothetical protein
MPTVPALGGLRCILHEATAGATMATDDVLAIYPDDADVKIQESGMRRLHAWIVIAWIGEMPTIPVDSRTAGPFIRSPRIPEGHRWILRRTLCAGCGSCGGIGTWHPRVTNLQTRGTED